VRSGSGIRAHLVWYSGMHFLQPSYPSFNASYST
jgi:hypothetical protein